MLSLCGVPGALEVRTDAHRHCQLHDAYAFPRAKNRLCSPLQQRRSAHLLGWKKKKRAHGKIIF